MRPNPLDDVFAFVTQPIWPTAAFWTLIVVGLIIAFIVWGRNQTQRRLPHIGRYVLRVVVGTMWWQQSAWKIPPNYDGLRYWMQQMVDHSWIPLQSRLVAETVIPNMAGFGPFVYGTEVLIAVSLMLGVFTRLGAALGALMALNLWLGLYSAPNEWPWTYGFLIVIQCMYVIDPPGRSLGVDAIV